jgi:phosphoribosylanthranilate isomerase
MQRVRVKICGITRTDDALVAVEAGADAIGLIFAESPRRVTVERAAEIVSVLPPWVTAVGVFVNVSPEAVAETVRRVGLTAVQLHGDEAPEAVTALSRQTKVIKSFRIGGAGDMAAAAEYLTRCRPSACLVDSRVEGVYGGTGLLAPWDLVAEARQSVRPLILSGGLDPENVAEAIRVVRPFGVDTASGVESEPGRKDAQRVRRFVRAAMEASATLF